MGRTKTNNVDKLDKNVNISKNNSHLFTDEFNSAEEEEEYLKLLINKYCYSIGTKEDKYRKFNYDLSKTI